MNDAATIQRQAAAGDPQAQVMLAFMLLTGRSVERSIPEAVHLIEASCAQGNPNAFVLNAVLAARGLGRPKSAEEAYRFISAAAARGHGPAQQQLAVLGGKTFDREPWTKPVELMQIADAPRIYAVQGFLPKNVCEWMMGVAGPRLQPATIFDPKGGTMRDLARTNMTAMLQMLEGDVIQQLISRRIAVTTKMSLEHHEPMNVLRYLPGEEYKPHYDFIRPWGPEGESFAAEIEQMGQRSATVLVYLNEGYEGGETAFPRLNLGYKGKTGDALIFWNVSASGELERDSLHSGTPVRAGEKWLLSQWIREKPLPLI